MGLQNTFSFKAQPIILKWLPAKASKAKDYYFSANKNCVLKV